MARAVPKSKADSGASTPTTSTDPLKPKTEKAKVTKLKSDKPAIKKEAGAKKDTSAKKDDAGKAEKVKPVTGDEAQTLILEYLRVQNRPFSATEITANLHGRVTKTVADKVMKEMEADKMIMMKATNSDTTKKGTQFVFWAIQDPADAASPEELAAMECTIFNLRENMPALKSSFKVANSKLTTLKAAPTTAELASTVGGLQESIKEKTARLAECVQSGVQAVSKEEVAAIEKELGYWTKKAGARKRAFDGMMGLLMEGMSREDIYEKAGIEL